MSDFADKLTEHAVATGNALVDAKLEIAKLRRENAEWRKIVALFVEQINNRCYDDHTLKMYRSGVAMDIARTELARTELARSAGA